MVPRLADFAAALRPHFDLSATPGSLDFNARALELFRLQIESCPAYRRLCDAAGVVTERVGSWESIPAVPTVAFQELEMTSIPGPSRIAVFHSSGTTGHKPSRHFHSRESLALYEASLLAWFGRQVLGDGDPEGRGSRLGDERGRVRFVALTPPPDQVPHSSLVHMLGTVMAARGEEGSCFLGKLRGDGAWEIDLGEARRVVGLSSAEGRPVVVLGTAFNFVHWLDDLAVQPLTRPLVPGSRVMETGGYKGRSREVPKSELHQGIVRHLGIDPTDLVGEYGMSELSSQAYDAGGQAGLGSRLFRFPPWARVLAISPETGRPVGPGERGLLRVFDLANVGSVLAIQTGDVGKVWEDGFELLGRAPSSGPRGCSLMAG